MHYNANKGEIMRLKVRKRESQMRNNANKGEKREITQIKAKNAKVKCERTQINAK